MSTDNRNRRSRLTHTETAERLEGKLRETLQPVAPRGEFVGELRVNLNRQLAEYRTNPPLNQGQIYLLVIATLFSTLMVVLLSVRAVMILSSAYRRGKTRKS